MLHQNCIILIVHACPFVFAACLNKAIEVVTSLETLEETHLFLWRIGEAGGFITSHCCLGEIIEVLRRFSSMYFTFLTIAFLPLFFLSTSCSLPYACGPILTSSLQAVIHSSCQLNLFQLIVLLSSMQWLEWGCPWNRLPWQQALLSSD